MGPHKIMVIGGLDGDSGGTGEQAHSMDKFCSCMLLDIGIQSILLENDF